ncbi:lipopolysaccharide biosynthesis protein [Curtobacterium sp. P97]|uniref:lipopolysaccharide biosynthesis protein n=1 Tax=Curtobacterium sp. P97 TaxID=2939562 RepID=UPI002040D371|nr:hypothetical protein [Curtobacterium sp. P97]MCM3521967.1 hypothetical protein [Curtobacterium sp. P97]
MTARAPRERPLAHQALLLAAATGTAQVLVAVLYLLAARGVEPAEFGATVSAIALGTAAAGFIDFGTNNHWTRELARKAMPDQLFEDRLFSKLVYTITAAGGWALLCLLFLPQSHVWLAGPITAALVINQAYQVRLRSAARGELVALVILCDRVAATMLFAGMSLAGVDAPVALWAALTAGSLAAAVIARRLGGVRKGGIRPRLTNPWSGAHFFGLGVVANSAQALDLTILSAVAGSTAAGVYGAVNRWTQPMALLAAAFSSALAPYAARSSTLSEAWGQLRRALWMPLGAIGVSIAVFFAAPFVVDLLLGRAYEDSSATLQVLALVVIPSIICQPLVVILQSFKRDRFVAGVMITAALGQLMLVLVLGGSSGALGAAQAALAAQIFILLALVGGTIHLGRSTLKE